MIIHRDRGGLDGDPAVLLVLPGVQQALVPGLLYRDDPGGRDQGVGEGGLAVVDVRDDGHVADLGGAVHDVADLIDGEVDHGREGGKGRRGRRFGFKG